MKSAHQVEDETKMIKQSAMSSLFKEIQNARAHFNPTESIEDKLYSDRMGDALQMYIYKEGQTAELKRLRDVAEKVREEIGDIERSDQRDITPSRMEFIDYRKAFLKNEKVKKVQ